jgi:hypothetical protein
VRGLEGLCESEEDGEDGADDACADEVPDEQDGNEEAGREECGFPLLTAAEVDVDV